MTTPSGGNSINRLRSQASGAAPVNAPRVSSPLGDKPTFPGVQTVFNSSPVDALGVAPCGGLWYTPPLDPGITEIGVFVYAVPANKVLLVDALSYSFFPIYTDVSSLVITLTVSDENLNNSLVTLNPHGLQSRENQPVFAIAGPGQGVTLTVRRVASQTWAQKYGALPAAVQPAFYVSFDATLFGTLLPYDSGPVNLAQTTRR